MLHEIRKHLIEVARTRRTCTYTELNNQLQLNFNFDNSLDRKHIGDWLGDISLHEYDKERPLISALVIHKANDKEQGDGFYKLCEGIYGENWESLKKDKTFEKRIIDECHEFWTDVKNYKDFINDY